MTTPTTTTMLIVPSAGAPLNIDGDVPHPPDNADVPHPPWQHRRRSRISNSRWNHHNGHSNLHDGLPAVVAKHQLGHGALCVVIVASHCNGDWTPSSAEASTQHSRLGLLLNRCPCQELLCDSSSSSSGMLFAANLRSPSQWTHASTCVRVP